ncbi:putative EF-hand domain pair protein [Plasmopara halstedii]
MALLTGHATLTYSPDRRIEEGRKLLLMEMETLAYLARSDSSDSDVASSSGRPTPLDPEYWRGITHSLEATTNSNDAYRRANRIDSPHSSYQYNQQQYRPSMSSPVSHQQHPVTSSSFYMRGHGAYSDGEFLMSPIHRQDGAPMISVSPVAQMNPIHERCCLSPSVGTLMHCPEERNNFHFQSNYEIPAFPVLTPQELKDQIREAMVRAQAYLDLVPYFQSCDLYSAGGISIRTIQEALGRVGVILRDDLLQSVSQLFRIPGSELVDYVAFGQFLYLDASELDNIRSIVAARRSVLENNSIELGDVFSQYDSYRTGFVSRSTFVTLLQDYSILIPQTTLHFMMITLAKSSDPTSISYVRFFEMANVHVASKAAVHLPHPRPTNMSPHHFSGCTAGQSNFLTHGRPARGYEMHPALPLATQTFRVVDHASSSPEFATPLPRLGWVCRVCTHQQIADWATHCEICETSKPRPGLRGEGFVKCFHCKFDNNYDLDECEMCGRTLNASNKKHLKSQKSRRSKKRYLASSSSSSSSESSSSSFSPSASRRTRKCKSERHLRSYRVSRKKSEQKPRFKRGEEIQAILDNERGYALGVISRVRPNRLYDIEFDNGSHEANVDEDCIFEVSRARIIKTWELSDSEESKRNTVLDEECSFDYEPGDSVVAQIQGQGRFIAGTIKKCHIDGSYDITYDRGEVEHRVSSKYIRQQRCGLASAAKNITHENSKPKTYEPVLKVDQPVEVH